MKAALVTLSIFILFACGPNRDVTEDINAELNALKSLEDHRWFLMNLKEKDQLIRIQTAELAKECGSNSKEVKLSLEQLHHSDAYTLKRVKAYLDRFGWPKKNDFAELSVVPLLVLHHASEYDVREEYFDQVWTAYENNEFDALWMSTFLERMHVMKYGSFSDLDKDCIEIIECKKLALGL